MKSDGGGGWLGEVPGGSVCVWGGRGEAGAALSAEGGKILWGSGQASAGPGQGHPHTLVGRLGGWEAGRLGGREAGRPGGWEAGRPGGWEAGRLGGWEAGAAGTLLAISVGPLDKGGTSLLYTVSADTGKGRSEDKSMRRRLPAMDPSEDQALRSLPAMDQSEDQADKADNADRQAR